MGSEGSAALQRLLAAFTLHAPELGYCQGMNFVGGALLLQLGGDEATAFDCLAVVADKVLTGYYIPNMLAPQVGLGVWCDAHWQHSLLQGMRVA